MRNALDDLHILAGDKVGQGDVTWQDVAGTAAVNLRHLAHLIDQAREGNATAREPIVFPSPDDLEGGR
jgi:hypothetical protein